jgi:hypothetical protein
MIGTTSSGISDQLRDIYSICRCCWDVATYKWRVHNGKIEIISFVVKFGLTRQVPLVEHELSIILLSDIPTERRMLIDQESFSL